MLRHSLIISHPICPSIPRELTVLEEDLEELRKFLNSSYQANDFYIKSAVNFTITLIDELALRSHIQNVPKLFTEMWQVMGESGQALRRSVKWIIETVSGEENLSFQHFGSDHLFFGLLIFFTPRLKPPTVKPSN